MKITLVLALMLAAPPLVADTITVGPNGDHPTINAALLAAEKLGVPGTTICVAPGVYTENITITGELQLIGMTQPILVAPECVDPDIPSADQVILDGGFAGPVVTFTSTTTAATVLDGFIIRNGFQAANGGGIVVDGGSPTIRNNLIINNESGASGGAIAIINGGNPAIRTNLIKMNLADMSGGGIVATGACVPTIEANVICENRARGADDTSLSAGGGIACLFEADALIFANVIQDNKSFVTTGQSANFLRPAGGGIYCRDASPSILFNRIEGNTTVGERPSGAAIACTDGSAPDIRGNKILRNGSTAEGLAGGALYSLDSSPTLCSNVMAGNKAIEFGAAVYTVNSTVALSNNTIVDNSTSNTQGITTFGAVSIGDSSTVTLRNTIIWDNTRSAPLGPGTDDIWADSTALVTIENCNVEALGSLPANSATISAPPLLENPATDDYRITHDSPCREAGLAGGLCGFDFENDPRVFNDFPDIGADEYYPRVDRADVPQTGFDVTLTFHGVEGEYMYIFAGAGLLSPPLVFPSSPWALQVNAPPAAIFPIFVNAPGSFDLNLNAPPSGTLYIQGLMRLNTANYPTKNVHSIP